MNEELKPLLTQSQDLPTRLRAYLLIATGRLDSLKATLTEPEQRALLAKVEAELTESLRMAYEYEAMVTALRDLANRLVTQRQSANDAYSAGWDARLSDILAQISNANAESLLKIVQDSGKRDQQIPF